ncbi:MAG: hypothetical protein J5979_06895 [Lachnospiraceae bacterium]|nr:hypothetical protein [Lachnospiraceae bacterium]
MTEENQMILNEIKKLEEYMESIQDVWEREISRRVTAIANRGTGIPEEILECGYNRDELILRLNNVESAAIKLRRKIDSEGESQF